jgi:DNA-binding HxlR family transcriptional regulator
VKTYGQRCSLARALDLIGERWSLLVVRELTLGSRRYRDLQDGLPGIPTNLLATRLKDLQAAGIITKRTLPPPTVVTVYDLTEAGRALAPAVNALRDWGAHYGSAPTNDDTIQPGWALMSASAHPTALPADRTCELRVGAEFFHVTGGADGLSVHGGPAPAADAVVTMSKETLYRLMADRTAPDAAIATVGDAKIAGYALATLRGVLADQLP